MLLQDQLLDIRYAINDMASHTYSDYQIVNALNTVIRQVNAQLSNMTSDLIKARTTLTLVNGAITLPTDFQSMVKMTDANNSIMRPRTVEPDTDTNTFEILNNQILANQPTVVLTYKKYFAEMDGTLSTNMPLPDFFKDVLTLYTKVILQGTMSQGDSQVLPPIEQKIMMLVGGRDKKQMKLKPIFRT
jgi:hypothetical protein